MLLSYELTWNFERRKEENLWWKWPKMKNVVGTYVAPMKGKKLIVTTLKKKKQE